MIFLKKIKLINFLSHKDSEIEFKENQRLLISGASGSGKSSIIEAIVWSLYGKGRSENKNLIKSGSKTATVILTLAVIDEDGVEHNYVINRSVTSAGRQTVTIIVDDKLLPVKGVKETQDFIEKDLLKASYVLFVNSIASPQENPDNFVKQTAAKKKELLLEISNIDNYDLYYNKVKDLLSESNDKTIKIETKLEEKSIQIEDLKDKILDEKELEKEKAVLQLEIEDLRKQVSIIEKEKNSIESVVKDISNKKQEIESLEKEVESLKNKINEKKDSLKKFDHLDEKNIHEGLAELTKVKDDLKKIDESIHDNYLIDLEYRAHLSSKPEAKNYEDDIKYLNSQLEVLYRDHDPKCPFCGKVNPILEKNIDQQLVMLKTQLDEKIVKHDEFNQQLMDWELIDALIVHPDEQKGVVDERNRLLGIISHLEHFSSDAGLLLAKNGALQDAQNDVMYFSETVSKNLSIITKLKNDLNELKDVADINRINFLSGTEQLKLSEINSKESELYTVIQKISSSNNASEQLQKINDEIKNLTAELKKIKKDAVGMNSLKDAFSPKGIKTIVIDYLVPRLEDKINAILQELSDFRIQIDTQKSSADEESVIEGLFVNIINPEGIVFEYSNYSGGEKMRVDYAISEALASLSCIKFRILDESIGALDEQMLSSFLEILEKMSGGYKQLIAISHIGQVKELFEDQITVTKKDGTSIIK